MYHFIIFSLQDDKQIDLNLMYTILNISNIKIQEMIYAALLTFCLVKHDM